MQTFDFDNVRNGDSITIDRMRIEWKKVRKNTAAQAAVYRKSN